MFVNIVVRFFNKYFYVFLATLIRTTLFSFLDNFSNNPVENAIRPFVIGRKAWLFANTVDGAKASALLYSLVETAKANNHEPYLWLSYVLNKLPKAKTVDDYEALLPCNLTTEQLITNQ